eukprot:SAG31_NODE_26552_length_440_cov_0.979472_1_plen_47_part_10
MSRSHLPYIGRARSRGFVCRGSAGTGLTLDFSTTKVRKVLCGRYNNL